MYNYKQNLYWTAIQVSLKTLQKRPLKWIIDKVDCTIAICIETEQERDDHVSVIDSARQKKIHKEFHPKQWDSAYTC